MPPSTPKATEPEIQAWCAAYLRTALKLPNLPDVEAEFPSLGLDSAESVFLVSAIEDWLGLELASDTALEYPSIAQLARFVAGRLAAKDAAQAGAVEPLDPVGSKLGACNRRSICSPGAPRRSRTRRPSSLCRTAARTST